MWNKLKQAADHPIWRGIKYFCGDPVQLYAVFLVMTGMYYYHEDWAWLYTLICFPLSFVLMRFYDFVAKRRFIGPLSYIAFMVAGTYAVTLLTTYGRRDYAISFFVWFLTPQGVVDFSLVYTIAIYLLMVGFLTSTVYYFGKVRYRMSMQFLIMLIPLSLYAKEARQMPALLVIALLSSFFLLMIYCRQLRDSEEVKQIPSFHSGVSIAVYVAAFSIIAAIIPKPEFQADREFIDNAMSYSTWSDTLMSMISSFMESTDNRGLSNNNARTLFYVISPESLRLRTQTFTYYHEDDSWNASDYDRPTLPYTEPLTYRPQDLLQAICDAAEADAAFAARYGLQETAGAELPEQFRYQISVASVSWRPADVLIAPTRTYSIDHPSDYTAIQTSPTGTMKIGYSTVTANYYPDTYARSGRVREVLHYLQHEDYAALLGDAADVLQERDADAAALLLQAQAEAEDADAYLAMTDEEDWRPEAVDALAAQLTEGLDSDLEKALAIEQYFGNGEYLYDMAYQKAPGENVEDFLLTTHRGVCWEYATAMTLLCRSAGLPARCAVGYNMGERYDNRIRFTDGEEWNTNFVIKARDAHAFPEVYIAGYGWVSFEPTIAADALEENGTAENLNVMRWGFVMLALALIVLVIWLMMPMIREKLFRSRLQKLTPVEAASAIFCRMRKTMRLPESTTVNELADASAPFFAEQVLYTQLDERLYSSDAGQQSAEAAAAYIRWDEAHKRYVKEQKRLARERRKAERRAKKA